MVSAKVLTLPAVCLKGALMSTMLAATVLAASAQEGPGSVITRPSSDPKAFTLSDPVANLNEAFRACYLNSKQDLLSKTDPVIVINGDKMILLQSGQRTEAIYQKPLFSVLKTVDHIPLALFVQLKYYTGSPLPEVVVDKIKQLRLLIAKARPAVAAQEMPSDTRERQDKIIDMSLDFLDRVLGSNEISDEKLTAFTRKVSPLVVANIDEAAALELEQVNSIVTDWKSKMTADQWKALKVVMLGSHMARQDGRLMQYFLPLLGDSQEGRRVIYMEGTGDEFAALDLLVTHILDADIGESFFGDPWRMHRDLLCEGARKYLEKHPPGR